VRFPLAEYTIFLHLKKSPLATTPSRSNPSRRQRMT
jgi:hypothetical protein